MSRYTVVAGDPVAVGDCIAKAAKRFKLGGRVLVHSVYEAGRDGWRFRRWLCELGVDNLVVDPSSIEVKRRARQAKTDRLDADKLLACLARGTISVIFTRPAAIPTTTPEATTTPVWAPQCRPPCRALTDGADRCTTAVC